MQIINYLRQRIAPRARCSNYREVMHGVSNSHAPLATQGSHLSHYVLPHRPRQQHERFEEDWRQQGPLQQPAVVQNPPPNGAPAAGPPHEAAAPPAPQALPGGGAAVEALPHPEPPVGNEGAVPPARYGEVPGNIQIRTKDVKEFYPSQDRLVILESIQSAVHELGLEDPFGYYVTVWKNRAVPVIEGLRKGGAFGLRWRRPKQFRQLWGETSPYRRRRGGADSLHRDNIALLSTLDFRWAVCCSGGRLYWQPSGIPTGTPAGPGDGDSPLAVPETKTMKESMVPWREAGAFQARWLDDLFGCAVVGSTPAWFQALAVEGHYGPAVRVEDVAPGEFAGVRFFVIEGEIWTVVLTPKESILLKESTFAQMRRRTSHRLAGGESWASSRRRVGVLTGLVLYVCDRTLGPEVHLRAQVSFLVKDMRLHGFSTRAIRCSLLAAQERVSRLNAPELLANEEAYFRAAVLTRQFAIQQGPWLFSGVPAARQRR